MTAVQTQRLRARRTQYRRWRGCELEALRVAYVGRAYKLKEIEQRFDILRPNILKLARRHGWPPRGQGAWQSKQHAPAVAA